VVLQIVKHSLGLLTATQNPPLKIQKLRNA